MVSARHGEDTPCDCGGQQCRWPHAASTAAALTPLPEHGTGSCLLPARNKLDPACEMFLIPRFPAESRTRTRTAAAIKRLHAGLRLRHLESTSPAPRIQKTHPLLPINLPCCDLCCHRARDTPHPHRKHIVTHPTFSTHKKTFPLPKPLWRSTVPHPSSTHPNPAQLSTTQRSTARRSAQRPFRTKACSARSTARPSAAALFTVSSYSFSGTLSATMPAPA